MARLLTDHADLQRALVASPTVAVVGAHHESWRPAFYVPEYLFGRGYRVLPVNPGLVGRTLWGAPVRATLAELTEPVDMVDVFRRSDQVPGHLADILAMDPRPSVVWLQLGIRHDATADALVEAGIDVVQSRCTLADHKRFGLGRPVRSG